MLSSGLERSDRMKRIVIPELLDTDAGTPQEIAASLGDLRAINRLFGGIAVMDKLLRRAANGAPRPLRLLDVATGSGDVPLAVREQAAQRGMELHVFGLDRAATHLNGGGSGSENARRATGAMHAELPRVAGDALALPFRDASFDFVSCSLFLHHLEPEQIVQFVNEGLRVCRQAVLINDLRRNALHLALVYAAWPFYAGRLTRHDAPASVRRAYTMNELRQMLGQTRATRVEIRPYYLQRMGAIAWK